MSATGDHTADIVYIAQLEAARKADRAVLRQAQQALWWRGPDRDAKTALFTKDALEAIKARLTDG